MSTAPPDTGTSAPADTPDASRRRWSPPARPLVATVLVLPAVLLSMAPALRFANWDWVVLLLAAPAVLWSAFPVHRTAITGLRHGAWSPQLLAGGALVATLAWSVPAVLDQRTDRQLAGLAVAGLTVIAQEVVARADAQGAETSTGRFVPLVLLLIAATGGGWWIADGGPAAASVVVSALIAACPAALMLAEPVALLAGTRRGAASGVRITSPAVLRSASRVDTIVLDQRGTVTTGELHVIAAQPLDPQNDRNLRWFAGALEHASDDRIGRAIARLSAAGRVADVRRHDGDGISGSVDRHPVRVGRPAWIGSPAASAHGRGTTVAVEVDGRALGHIAVAEQMRPHARAAVEELRALGLDPVLVSSGPAADVEHAAAEAGIERTHAGLADQGVRDLVEALQEDGHVVALVAATGTSPQGLAAADLALGDTHLRTGLAMRDLDVATAVRALRIARATLATAQLNRRIAFAGMLVGVALAAAGVIGPVQATLVAVASGLAVAINTLRMPRESAT